MLKQNRTASSKSTHWRLGGSKCIEKPTLPPNLKICYLSLCVCQTRALTLWLDWDSVTITATMKIENIFVYFGIFMRVCTPQGIQSNYEFSSIAPHSIVFDAAFECSLGFDIVKRAQQSKGFGIQYIKETVKASKSRHCSSKMKHGLTNGVQNRNFYWFKMIFHDRASEKSFLFLSTRA